MTDCYGTRFISHITDFQREIMGLPFDKQILIFGASTCNIPEAKRIIIRDDLHCRQYYKDLGEVSYLPFLKTGQLLKMLLKSLHGKTGNHPGISEMKQKI